MVFKRLNWPVAMLLLGAALSLAVLLLAERREALSRESHLAHEREQAQTVAEVLLARVRGAEEVLLREVEFIDQLVLIGLDPYPSGPKGPMLSDGQLEELNERLRAASASSHISSLSILNRQGQVLASSHPSNQGLLVPLEALSFRAPLSTYTQFGQARWPEDWHVRGADLVPAQQGDHLAVGKQLSVFRGDDLYLVALVDMAFLLKLDHDLVDDLMAVAWLSTLDGQVVAVTQGATVARGQPLQDAFDSLQGLDWRAGAQGMLNVREAGPGAPEFKLHYRVSSESPLLLGLQVNEARLMDEWYESVGRRIWVARTVALLIFLTFLVLAFTLQRLAEAKLSWEASQSALRESEAAKTAFLANVTHELRTPLNAIVGLTEVLQQEVQDPAHRGHLLSISRSSRTLVELISRVVDYARLQAGALALADEPFDLHLLFDDWKAMAQERGQGSGLDIRFTMDEGTPRHVRGDPTRLLQVWQVLSDNAIRFTPQGQVVVALKAQGLAHGVWNLACSITDTGPGFSAELADRVFRGFVQADGSITRSHGGVGLSLALARQLARLMGGDVRIATTGPGGTQLDFLFQLKAGAAAVTPMAALTVAERGPVRVLSVEDVSINQQLMVLLLTKLGCVVETASNGREAVDMTAANAYDLVFMDLQMPEMDGLQACRAIRAREGAQVGAEPVPIVAVTAHGDTADRSACIAAGMSGFVVKPISGKALKAQLEGLTTWRDPGEPAKG